MTTKKEEEEQIIEFLNIVVIPIRKMGNFTDLLPLIQEKIEKWQQENPHKEITSIIPVINQSSSNRGIRINSVTLTWRGNI